MKNTFYITTTLPYVNAKPHIGHALEFVQADALARYRRSLGDEVVFNTGTDEHGQKIYDKAIEENKDPQAYTDEYAEKFDDMKLSLDLSYTHFIRTTDPGHMKAAQEFWKRCADNGDIYKKQYSVKYCVGCELEKTDSELVNDKCPIHPNLTITLINEENYFFRFSAYQQKLIDLYTTRPDFVVPSYRLQEIKNFVESGLNDFSISRLKEKMPWGVPVPGDDLHIMYVWFDALVNYVSTLGWPDESGEFSEFWPGVQVAGKDNLRQQSAMWQAMLMSAKIEPSKQIFIHGFITANGQKMSKSLGNVVDPIEYATEFGSDAFRYYLLREIPYGDDGDFSRARMEERYSELANRLGNLVGRVAAMAQKYFEGNLDPVEMKLEEKYFVDLKVAMDQFDFKAYIDKIFEIVDEANEIIDKKAPFKLVKEDPVAAKLVLSEVSEMIRYVARTLACVIPKASEEILRRYGTIVVTGDPLFPRRDV